MSTQDQGKREQQEAWELLGSVKTHPTVQSWLNDIDLRGPALQRRRRNMLAMAAGVLLAAGLAVGGYIHFTESHYETRVGEQRDVILPDGSRVTLNTDTSLTVQYSKARRYIELHHGEALFSVKHDARWPFDVSAGTTLTRALGTAFNVDFRRSKVTVSVLTGAVRVSTASQLLPQASSDALSTGRETQTGLSTVAPALAAGEALEVRSKGPAAAVVSEKADLRRINAWRTRRLEFTDTPLPAAVEEFNRYCNLRLVIGTPELESVHVSGVFSIGDVDGFVFSLREALDVKALDSPGEITLVRTHS